MINNFGYGKIVKMDFTASKTKSKQTKGKIENYINAFNKWSLNFPFKLFNVESCEKLNRTLSSFAILLQLKLSQSVALKSNINSRLCYTSEQFVTLLKRET